jgi:hypothetical protein
MHVRNAHTDQAMNTWVNINVLTITPTPIHDYIDTLILHRKKKSKRKSGIL